jgi:hypothetical protein
MTDAELVEAFETGTLGPEAFPHAAHVRVARWYLLHEPTLIAMARFRASLQRFAARIGKPDRYHETITIAYLVLIAERIGASRDESWEAFAALNADLLQSKPSALDRFYSPELLASPRAREGFVWPDADTTPSSRGSSTATKVTPRGRRGAGDRTIERGSFLGGGSGRRRLRPR